LDNSFDIALFVSKITWSQGVEHNHIDLPKKLIQTSMW